MIDPTVDLNADMDEEFGRYSLDDGALPGAITSASIACSFHAGDPIVMRNTVASRGHRLWLSRRSHAAEPARMSQHG